MSKEQKSYILLFLGFSYILVLIGVVMNFSISPALKSGAFSLTLFNRYIISVAIGSILMIIFSLIDYRFFKKIAPFILLVIFLLLFFTKPSPDSVSKRWIFVGGPFAFQPSQYVSLFLTFFIAKVLSNDIEKENRTKIYVFLFSVVLLFTVKVAFEPDLGTAFIIFVSEISLIFLAGIDLKLFAGLIGITLFSGLLAVRHSTNWSLRVRAFLHPSQFASGKGYQALQSFRAIARGGITGVGLMKSYFKYGSLPENGPDFIFAIVGEELGFIGETTIVLFFFLFTYIGFRLSNTLTDRYARFLVAGIILNLFVGAFVNIASNIGLLPVTGVPLPFVSYSGNNIVVSFISLGILINVVKEEIR